MTTRQTLKRILLIVLAWRIATVAAILVGQQWLPFRPNATFTELDFYTQDQIGQKNQVINSLANFDGVHYINIARRGYIDEARFFPVFPGLIRTTSYILKNIGLQNTELIIGVVLSHFFLVMSGVVLVRLSKEQFKQSNPYLLFTVLMAFPTSFFFGSVYSESLFLYLVVSIFLLAHKKQWLAASFTAMLITVTRLVGIVLVPILILLWWQQRPKKISLIDLLYVFSFFCIPLGLIAYGHYNYLRWGEWSYFITAHTLLANSREAGIVNPAITVYRYVRIFLTKETKLYEWWIAQLEFLSGVFSGSSVLQLWKTKLNHPYFLYTLLVLAMPVVSGTLSGFPRYLLVAFPIFLAISSLSKKWLIAYFCISIPLLLILTALFSRGYFVA